MQFRTDEGKSEAMRKLLPAAGVLESQATSTQVVPDCGKKQEKSFNRNTDTSLKKKIKKITNWKVSPQKPPAMSSTAAPGPCPALQAAALGSHRSDSRTG